MGREGSARKPLLSTRRQTRAVVAATVFAAASALDGCGKATIEADALPALGPRSLAGADGRDPAPRCLSAGHAEPSSPGRTSTSEEETAGPCGYAIDESRYVVEVFAEQVQPSSQQGPTALAFDSQGNMYIAPGGNRVPLKIPAGSSTPESFGSIAVADADGIAVDSQDNVIVSGSPYVVKLAPDGTLLWEVACPIGNVQLVTVDDDDSLYVGSLGTQVAKIPSDGTSVTALGDFNEPSEPAVGKDGLLYVSQLAAQNIVRANPDTAEIMGVVVSGIRALQPAFDAAGDLFVGNGLTGEILKISLADGSVESIAAGFTKPRGLAFDGDGSLYIADSAEKAICKLSPATLPEGRIAVDIKPRSCPNPINVKSRGVLPVAILGTADLDVTTIDPGSVRLEGVAPLRSAIEDVATPFVPVTGKADLLDCSDLGPDGWLDLTLKFDTQQFVTAVSLALGRDLEDGEVLVLRLWEALGLAGEDVVVIRDRPAH